MTKRARSHFFRAASAVALALLIAGCTKGGQFDPTELFSSDVFDSKKKLKGERTPVFPEGVPGATSGVPADLVKGYQAPPEQPDADAAVPGPAPPSNGSPQQAQSSQPVWPTPPQTSQPSQSIWPNPPAPSGSSQ